MYLYAILFTYTKKRNINFIIIPWANLRNIGFCAALPFPDNIPVSILHNIFIKGDQMSFELTEKDLEASKLYPDYNYTSVDDLLNRCLVDPPKTKLAAFA